jgi:hypothetical protein
MTARGRAIAVRRLSVPGAGGFTAAPRAAGDAPASLGSLFFTVASAAVPFPFYLPARAAGARHGVSP